MKQLAKAMAWFTSGSFVGTLTQVAKGKLVAVLLGPEGMGVLGQLTNAWTLINTLSGLGFYNGVVKRIAQAKGADDTTALLRQLSTSLLFLTVFSCLIAVVTTAISPWISQLIFNDRGQRAGLVALMLISVPFAVTAQTYRGLLSGCQLVRPIVAAQVLTDLVSLAMYAVLLYSYGLTGAVIGFGSLHVLKLMFQLITVRRALCPAYTLPRPQYFSWSEVRVNLRFGGNGLVMSGLGIITMLLVSRWIISDLGIDSNGVFSVAWKVGTLYLGAFYAAAGGYYFPSLAACKNDDELALRINEAVTLYQFVLPPIVAALIIGGELLVHILFSGAFVGAAILLAFMLPGDLFRVTAETVGLSFLARGKLLVYTATYAVWAAIFLSLSYFWLPRFGLIGVAYAYLVSQAVNMASVLFLASRSFRFRLATQSTRAIVVGVLAASLAILSILYIDIWQIRYLLGIVIIFAWLGASWRDESFRSLLLAARAKVKI